MESKATTKRRQSQSSNGGHQKKATVGRKQSKKQNSVNSTTNAVRSGPLVSKGPKRKRSATDEIKNSVKKKPSKSGALNEVDTSDVTATINEANGNEGDVMSKGMECVICQDTQESQDFVFMPCGHRFHRQCNDKWIALRKYCALCMADITGRSDHSRRITRNNTVFIYDITFI